MNPNPDSLDSRWDQLVRQSRTDAPPPVDVTALLRVVGQAEIAPSVQEEWTSEISALFPSARMIPTCLAAAAAFAAVATWHAWDTWQALPWIQLIDPGTGGAS
jgi:hypothetical protein